MNKRVAYYDLIRVIACACVLIIHFNASFSGYDIGGEFLYPNYILPNNVFNGNVYLGGGGSRSIFYFIRSLNVLCI